MQSKSLGFLMSFVLFVGLTSQAAVQGTPACLSHGHLLPIDDLTVLNWKHTTPNQFQSRAHIVGEISQVYPNRNGHQHFQVRLDMRNDDTIEVIYNMSFGPIPAIHSGMKVEACGDYITSTAPGGGYPASPDGALIHWSHRSPNPVRHDSGFVSINGVLFGQ